MLGVVCVATRRGPRSIYDPCVATCCHRRGYVAGRDLHAIRPLDIDYEDACEEEIAAAVSRLDEIGDLVDGEVSTGEILDLLQLLDGP